MGAVPFDAERSYEPDGSGSCAFLPIAAIVLRSRISVSQPAQVASGIYAIGIIRITMALASGARLDSYEILSLLGSGGMGEV